MALRNNIALRTAIADAIAALWSGGTLEIRTGSQPADPDSAATGTLLCTINIPTPAFGAAATGAINKAGTWNGIAIATGTAGWARLISADNLKSRDLSVTESGGGGDLIIDDEDILIDGSVTVTSLVFRVTSGM